MDGDMRHLRRKLNPIPLPGEGSVTNTKDKSVAAIALQSVKVISAFGVALDDREDYSDQESSVRRISLDIFTISETRFLWIVKDYEMGRFS